MYSYGVASEIWNNEDIRYYNMMIQTSEDIYRSVSYREDLRNKLLKVEKNLL